MYLASAAQDRKVRLWLLQPSSAAAMAAAAASRTTTATAVPNAAELLAALDTTPYVFVDPSLRHPRL